MKTSKEAKSFLKQNRKKNPVLPGDKELRTFLSHGGRPGAKKDFFSFLKRVVKI